MTTSPVATARPASRRGRPRSRARYFATGLVLVPISMVGVVIISFLLVALIPASTALSIAGQGASAQDVAEVNDRLGLNDPVWVQLKDYIVRLFHGDLGSSYYTGKPVVADMFSHLPATLELIVPALLLGILGGLTLGTLAGYYAGRPGDYIVRTIGSCLQAMPEFLVGLLLIYVVFFLMGVAPPPTGRLDIASSLPPHRTGFVTIDAALAGQWETLIAALRQLMLPVLTISLAVAAVLSRITRAAIGDAFRSAHVEYARALGLPTRRVVRYALVDIRTPVLTFCAALVAGVVDGAAIVEIVFNWNGTGQWGLTAMTNLDVPQIQAFVLFSGLATFLTYFVLDIVATALDPRISLGNP